MPIVEQLPGDLQAIPGLAAAWTQFAERQRAVGEAVAQSLANSDQSFEIRLADGELIGNVGAREFADHYGKVTWSVLSFEPGNDGLGATINHFEGQGADRRWVRADARILPDGLLRFHEWGAKGHNYLALHETAHTTSLGILINEQCWNRHLANTPHIPWGQANPWWLRNEKTANNIMRTIAEQLNLPYLPTPGGAWDDDGSSDPDLLYVAELAVLEGAGH